MSDFLFFLKLGWQHIISADALDHQLFILVLVATYLHSDWRKILILVTAFTLGHTITLFLSVLDIFRLPPLLVETLIPITIILTALDNIFFQRDEQKRRIFNFIFALLFGLIHGMGFANTARMAIASKQDIAVPLLGFNIGLELGQIIVVFALMIAYYISAKFMKFNKKYWTLGISCIAILFSVLMIWQRVF